MIRMCQKCGRPIAFKRLASGKWCPTNVDGSDHWDTCRGIVRTPEWCAARIAQEHREFPSGWRGTASHVWSGDIPPWDESLGDFRDFTDAEKAAGEVCVSNLGGQRNGRHQNDPDPAQQQRGVART